MRDFKLWKRLCKIAHLNLGEGFYKVIYTVKNPSLKFRWGISLSIADPNGILKHHFCLFHELCGAFLAKRSKNALFFEIEKKSWSKPFYRSLNLFMFIWADFHEKIFIRFRYTWFLPKSDKIGIFWCFGSPMDQIIQLFASKYS